MNTIKAVFKKYPITLSVIVAVGLLFTGFMGMNPASSKVGPIAAGILSLCIWAFCVFFSETYFPKSRLGILIDGIGFGIALLFIRLFGSFSVMTVLKLIGIYEVVLLFLTICKIQQQANLPWGDYLLSVFQAAFNSTIVCVVILVCIILVHTLFKIYVFDIGYTFLTKVCTLVLGLFYIPSWLYALALIEQKEVSSFTKSVVVIFAVIFIGMLAVYGVDNIESYSEEAAEDWLDEADDDSHETSYFEIEDYLLKK